MRFIHGISAGLERILMPVGKAWTRLTGTAPARLSSLLTLTGMGIDVWDLANRFYVTGLIFTIIGTLARCFWIFIFEVLVAEHRAGPREVRSAGAGEAEKVVTQCQTYAVFVFVFVTIGPSRLVDDVGTWLLLLAMHLALLRPPPGRTVWQRARDGIANLRSRLSLRPSPAPA